MIPQIPRRGMTQYNLRQFHLVVVDVSQVVLRQLYILRPQIHASPPTPVPAAPRRPAPSSPLPPSPCANRRAGSAIRRSVEPPSTCFLLASLPRRVAGVSPRHCTAAAGVSRRCGRQEATSAIRLRAPPRTIWPPAFSSQPPRCRQAYGGQRPHKKPNGASRFRESAVRRLAVSYV